MYEKSEDEFRYIRGIDGAHVMMTFQCDTCIFRTLYARNPSNAQDDISSMGVIRRINLDAMWSREPSTIANNSRNLSKLIRQCEQAGIDPQLPSLGPWPIEDVMGYGLAFSMIVHSWSSGRHSKSHTQFATIRRQRAAYSNLFQASVNMKDCPSTITQSNQGRLHLANCPSNSIWFSRWSRGCETRMGYIIKQDKALSLPILQALIKRWIEDIELAPPNSWNRLKSCMALTYTTISFVASLRGPEGLKIDLSTLKRHINQGKETKSSTKGSLPSHVILPLRGRFKGESGERCHLLPLANYSKSGIQIRSTLELLINARSEMPHLKSHWAFVTERDEKLSFQEMNKMFHDGLEKVKEEDSEDLLGLLNTDIHEEYSINRSCRRGSATHAQNQKIPEATIRMQNRWSMIETSKGRRPNFNMVETYSDIEYLIPAIIQYSGQL